MTISSEDRKAGPYDGNGVATLFPFAFKVIAATYVEVYFTSPEGVEQILTFGDDYSVTLNPDQEVSPGGEVQTFIPLALNAKLTITSNVPNLQPLALTNQGGFFPGVINAAFDRVVILIQQLASRIGRTLRAPITDPEGLSMVLPGAADRANAILAFDATGKPVAYPLSGVPGGGGGGGTATIIVELKTATAGQTVFNLTNAYTPGNNSLSVFVNGLRATRGVDFTETNATRVTFLEALEADDRVTFVIGVAAPGGGGSGSGDMLKSVYDTNNSGVVDAAESVPWSGVGSKPSTFPPSSHSHVMSDIDSLVATLDAMVTAINGKQAELVSGTNIKTINGASLLGSGNISIAGSGVTDHGALSGLEDDDHTQYFNQSRGDARYSQTGHTHAIANVTGLQAALDAKAATTTPTITGLREVKVAVAAAAIDMATGNLFSKTISGAITFTVSNVPATGTLASFMLDLTNGGSATITWWSGMKWAGGSAPALTAAGRDVLGFYTHDGGTTWTGMLLAKDAK